MLIKIHQFQLLGVQELMVAALGYFVVVVVVVVVIVDTVVGSKLMKYRLLRNSVMASPQ